jgi:hypothetical protein
VADSTSKDVGVIAAIGLAILIYLYLSKPKVSLQQASNGAPKNCGCGGGCGACSQSGPPSINVTTPPNVAGGKATAGRSVLHGGRHGYASQDNAGPPAPGSNASAPGSGAQWQGIRQTGSTLTPASAPHSPSAPTGKGVWSANATPTGVPA